MGLHFIDQAGSNYKMKTLAQILFSMSTDTKSMGLCFIDQAGSNYKTKTLAQMLCSMSTDTKSMGLCFVDQAGSNPRLNALFDVNGHKINVQKAGSNYKTKTLASTLS